MASIHQHPLSSTLYFQQRNSLQKSMPSPYSVPSPFSSASSTLNENSPISDNIPSPTDAVNNDPDVAVFPPSSASIQIFTSQGDIAAPYASDIDYDMMAALSSDLKRTQLPSLRSLPPSQLFSSPHHHHPLPHLHDTPFAKAMHTVYIPPPIPPQRHNQPSPPTAVRPSFPVHPIRSIHRRQRQQRQTQSHLHAQQSLAPPLATANVGNDVMFDVDLDDWSTSPTAVHPHGHPNTSYTAPTLDSQPTPRPKQDGLLFDGAMSGYPAATAASTQHQPHVELQNQFYDVTGPIIPPQNADSTAALPQARISSRYSLYQQHQQLPPGFYSPSHFPQPRLPYSHQQLYATVQPAEVSPLDSNSPVSAFPDLAATGVGAVGTDGNDLAGYVCATDMGSGGDLDSALGIELGSGLTIGSSVMQPNWSSERKPLDADMGDLDAEGEDEDPLGVEQSLGSLSNGPSVLSADPDDGETGLLFDDTDGSKFSDDSSSDSDDSEFVPGSMPRRRRRPQRTMSSSYPSSAYTEGRALRTRSGTRYAPYPNEYLTDNSGDYMDQQSYDGSPQSGHSKRFAGSSSPTATTPDLTTLQEGYLNFTTLSTTTSNTSRRRPRPTNSLPIPIPIPHLTKKSRGRRVPTVTSLEDLRSATSGAGRKRQAAGKGARMYLCEVEGCGKCFARGEHLKRHVRSIHTYEKPHRCPYPGCGKEFSRHDNLGQHMRVHKDYVPAPNA